MNTKKKLPKLRFFLERKCNPEIEPEKIDTDSFEKFKLASRCIECLSCVSVCPAYAKNPHEFLGPMGYVLEARHLYDPRDELNREVVLRSEGIDLCIECGLCTKACNSKVAPAETIIELKRMVK